MTPRELEIKRAFTHLSEDEVKKVGALMSLNHYWLPERTQEWVRTSYVKPRPEAVSMDAIRRLVGGYCIAHLETADYVDRFYKNTRATYVSVGESYKPTIVYDTVEEYFYCMPLTDYMTNLERRGVKFR